MYIDIIIIIIFTILKYDHSLIFSKLVVAVALKHFLLLLQQSRVFAWWWRWVLVDSVDYNCHCYY